MLCGNLSQIDSQIISILYPLSAAFPDQLVFRGWVHCEKAKAHNSGWYLAKSNKIKSNVVFLVIGNGIYTLFSCKFSFLWFGHWKLTTSTEPICLNKFLEPPYCPPWSKIGFAQAQPGKFSKKNTIMGYRAEIFNKALKESIQIWLLTKSSHINLICS